MGLQKESTEPHREYECNPPETLRYSTQSLPGSAVSLGQPGPLVNISQNTETTQEDL